MSFQYKYLKYKNKYLDLKNEITQKGGSNTNTSIIQKKCNNCQKTNSNLLACGRCKSVYYCNSTCQNADWSTHKSVCNSTKLISCIKCKKLNINSDHDPNRDHDQIIDNFMRSDRQNMDHITNIILIAEIVFNKHMTEEILTSEMNNPFNTKLQREFNDTIKLTTFIRRKIFNNIYDINDIKNFIKFYLTLLKDKNFTNSKYIRYYLILIKSLYNFIKNKFPKYNLSRYSF